MLEIFFDFIYLFFLGSMVGYIIELVFRRIVHGKWVNPGFLVGPYLPIYGFATCALTLLYLTFDSLNTSPLIVIILMGLSITLIELIGGLTFINTNVRLWDYSKEWGNFKGIICPKFTLAWILCGAIYYYFLAGPIMNSLKWFNHNPLFSFVLGIFIGVISIDLAYSTKTLSKIKKYAKENQINVRLEDLKLFIKNIQENNREKFHFIFPFKQTKPLSDYLNIYKKEDKKQKRKEKTKRWFLSKFDK